MYVALSRAKHTAGLQIKNFNPKKVTSDSLVKEFYDALERKDTKKFLDEKAGLWWYPILKSPTWTDMFSSAHGKYSRENSKQFREWISVYRPKNDYMGWGM